MAKHRTLKEFWRRHSEWSQETFGKDSERGPVGPLKHLAKEVEEALDEALKVESPKLAEELADCQFLIFDAVRRAGLTYESHTKACYAKLEKNKARIWANPTSDEPVEHIREMDPADKEDVYS